MKKALLVTDVQNDWSSGGNYPLWNTEAVLENTVAAIHTARGKGIPVIVVQHVADPQKGLSPFFNGGNA